MVQNVWYVYGWPHHVTVPFEYRTPQVSDESGIQVQYSDGYCIIKNQKVLDARGFCFA